jgi:glycosyltransferase involved in cell wall biosynthesis
LNLVVVSYKVCWRSDGRFVSFGGFPQQMSALAQLFTSTSLLILERDPPPPQGAVPILGRDIDVRPSPEPYGEGLMRKLGLISWAAVHGPRIVGEIKTSDVVHAAVPGDVGILGLMVSLALRKLTFVRHCGTWDDRSTLANRFLAWLLPRIAGGRVVVLATGGGPEPPEPRNPDIQWIFSTSFSQAEFEGIEPAARWVPGSPLRLVTVGRLTRGKNALACIEALPAIRAAVPGSTLEIVGDGPFRGELERAVVRLGLDGEVSFTGNLNHEAVIQTLCRSNLFLFPTRVAEGFPKAVLEAMACGLPIVAAPVSVLPTLLGDGCGVLLDGTEAGDVEGAVTVLVNDPDRMAKMGLISREIASGYTLERWRDLIRERLESAWGRPLKNDLQSGEPAEQLS